MSNYFLCIETSHEICSVALGHNGELAAYEEVREKNKHAEMLPSLSATLLKDAGIALADLNCIVISAGPGSYTGLRVGTSYAKGLCFALGIPLIAVNTLEAMASTSPNEKVIAMLYAGRQESYCLMKNERNEIVQEAQVVNFEKGKPDWWPNPGTLFKIIGNGYLALDADAKGLQINANMPTANMFVKPSAQKIIDQEFANLAYFEPEYLKEYIPGNSGNKLQRLLKAKK